MCACILLLGSLRNHVCRPVQGNRQKQHDTTVGLQIKGTIRSRTPFLDTFGTNNEPSITTPV